MAGPINRAWWPSSRNIPADLPHRQGRNISTCSVTISQHGGGQKSNFVIDLDPHNTISVAAARKGQRGERTRRQADMASALVFSATCGGVSDGSEVSRA